MPIGWKTQRFHEVDSGRKQAAPHDKGGTTLTHSKFAIASARQLDQTAFRPSTPSLQSDRRPPARFTRPEQAFGPESIA
jgi:hypothetical protein